MFRECRVLAKNGVAIYDSRGIKRQIFTCEALINVCLSLRCALILIGAYFLGEMVACGVAFAISLKVVSHFFQFRANYLKAYRARVIGMSFLISN